MDESAARRAAARAGRSFVLLVAALSCLPALESRTVLRPPDVGERRGDMWQKEGGPDWRAVGMATVLRRLAETRPSRAEPEWGAALGLRLIQRRPEDVFGPHSARVSRAGLSPSTSSLDWTPQKRSLAGEQTQLALAGANKSSAGWAGDGHQFIYVVSPTSELVHPFRADRYAQGYTNLVPLAGSYAVGLQRTPDGERLHLKWPIESLAAGLPAEATKCRTTRELVELRRDESDPPAGQPARQCSGSVELNTCGGFCPSGIQPSIKSLTGIVKKCSCCSESAFRRVQVRLNKCSPMVAGVDDPQLAADVLGGRSFMDIEVEEPIGCKCRQCESLI